MAWSPLPVKAAGDLFDLAAYNICKDDFDASAPGVVAVKGDLVVATAVNAIARLAVGANDTILVAASGEATGLAWQITPAVRVSDSGDTDPAVSTWVTLTFDTEVIDTDGLHSLVANTSRITIPANADGVYMIGGNAEFDTSGYGAGGNKYGLRFRLNGVTVIATNLQTRSHGNIDHSIALTTLYALSATDYVELQVWTGTDVDVLNRGDYSPVFWAQWTRMP